MNKRRRATIFSFFSTLATLSIGAKVGASQGRGMELAIIVGGLVMTLAIGLLINLPARKNPSANNTGNDKK